MREQSQFATTIAKVVDAAGAGEAFRTADHFHIRIKNARYMDLIIESFPSSQYPGRRNVSVAHYYEQNGDLVPDPEVEMVDTGMPIGLTQWCGYTRCVWEESGRLMMAPRAKAEVMSFLTLWGRNIRAQGFIEAAHLQAERDRPAFSTQESIDDWNATYSAFCD